MNLTEKELKFLTILNEARLSNGRLLKRYSESLKESFLFSDEELVEAIKKLKSRGMLSEMDLGSNEMMYFFTDKVSEDMIDKKLEAMLH